MDLNREEGAHKWYDAGRWWVEVAPWWGLCRYFLLDNWRGVQPLPREEQRCHTCAACAPIALCSLGKHLSFLALIQSSSVTNISACCLLILWRWVQNHPLMLPEEATCTTEHMQQGPAPASKCSPRRTREWSDGLEKASAGGRQKAAF